MAQLTGGPVMGAVRRTPEGLPPKRCVCGREGEWPGRRCPDCANDSANDSTSLLGQAADARTSTLVPAHERRRLPELAAIANREHEQILLRGRELIDAAIRAGDALLEARDTVPRGEWLAWMERNVRMDGTTAYRYMRIAEHKDLVRKSHAESLKDAMMVLADLPRRGHGPLRYSQADKETWVELVDQVGVKRAAAALGVAVSTISRWAGPTRENRGAGRPRATSHPRISDDAIERLGQWLVERFGGTDDLHAGQEYPMRVTAEVRADALEALEAAFDVAQPIASTPANPAQEELLPA